jgi:hypothetical protein
LRGCGGTRGTRGYAGGNPLLEARGFPQTPFPKDFYVFGLHLLCSSRLSLWLLWVFALEFSIIFCTLASHSDVLASGLNYGKIY